ncbi:uncharacterized protein [Apostichopus japonicus]|uniref:uncharacterized protein isoform X3 n=1 Tax=Stichopus japonicus TaxID=307972 RepID=UPI003AB49A57
MSQCPFSPELEFDNSNQKTRGQPLVDLLQSPLSESSTQSILKPSSKENIISFTPPPNRSLKVTFQTPILTPKFPPAKVTAYEAVRELDEKENWSERAEVIFKTEHEQLVEVVEGFLEDLINHIPLIAKTVTDPPTVGEADRPDSPPSEAPSNHPRTMSEEMPIPKKEKKSIYEMTDEELARMDPFSSSAKGITNSPPVKTSGKSIYELSDEDLAKMNPFASKTTVQNSPPRQAADMNANAMDSETKVETKQEAEPANNSEEEKKDEVKSASPPEQSTEEKKPKKRSPGNKKPTKLKGPRKVTKKPSPKKEIVETEEVKEEAPIDLSSGDIPSTQDVNMNREDMVVGDQQDLPTNGPVGDDDIPVITEDEFRPGTEGRRGNQISPDEMEFRRAERVFASDDPAAFDMDFLEKMGDSNDFHASALARQSLYVKFDPLMKDLNGQKQGVTLPASSVPPTILEGEDLLQMQTPPQRRSAAPVGKETQPPTSQETVSGVDKLLSYSPSRDETEAEDKQPETEVDGVESQEGSPPFVKAAEEGIVQPLRYSQADLEAAIETKVRIALEHAGRESRKKYDDYDKEMKDMTTQQQSLEKSNAEMRALTAEYEKAMQQLMGDISQTKTSSDDRVQQLQKEKDQALEDLSSVENAFSDLHKRYEKLKATVQGYKKNEDVLKKCVEEHQSQLKKQELKYQTLKGHAEDKIKVANEEIDKMKKSYGAEISGLQANLKREQLKVASLERTVEEKTRENKELTNICDELISQVGGGGH